MTRNQHQMRNLHQNPKRGVKRYLSLEVGRHGLEDVDVLLEVVRLLADKQQEVSLDVSAKDLLSRLLSELSHQGEPFGGDEVFDGRFREVRGQVDATLVKLTNQKTDKEVKSK